MKSRYDGTYRHFIPKLSLSIERNTARVPSDGKFYILREGQIVDNFWALGKAEARFRQLVKESGYKPEVAATKPRSVADEALERYLDVKDLYWAESYKYRGKGGKGGRGGI